MPSALGRLKKLLLHNCSINKVVKNHNEIRVEGVFSLEGVAVNRSNAIRDVASGTEGVEILPQCRATLECTRNTSKTGYLNLGVVATTRLICLG